VKDLQLTLLVSVYFASSCVMTWWWPEFRVETSYHTNKTIYKWVGCDCEWLFLLCFLHQNGCFKL